MDHIINLIEDAKDNIKLVAVVAFLSFALGYCAG